MTAHCASPPPWILLWSGTGCGKRTGCSSIYMWGTLVIPLPGLHKANFRQYTQSDILHNWDVPHRHNHSLSPRNHTYSTEPCAIHSISGVSFVLRYLWLWTCSVRQVWLPWTCSTALLSWLCMCASAASSANEAPPPARRCQCRSGSSLDGSRS